MDDFVMYPAGYTSGNGEKPGKIKNKIEKIVKKIKPSTKFVTDEESRTINYHVKDDKCFVSFINDYNISSENNPKNFVFVPAREELLRAYNLNFRSLAFSPRKEVYDQKTVDYRYGINPMDFPSLIASFNYAKPAVAGKFVGENGEQRLNELIATFVSSNVAFEAKNFGGDIPTDQEILNATNVIRDICESKVPVVTRDEIEVCSEDVFKHVSALIADSEKQTNVEDLVSDNAAQDSQEQ